jgi:uncharacterized membrane protein
MLSNLTPAQEPVAWGALVTALLELAVVFAPRFGIEISVNEQAALAGLFVVAIPIIVGLFVRQSTTPVAVPPAPAPPATPTA